jgi:hypothetical protein
MEVIFLLGAAQALFLAILVFNKKGKSQGDYMLGSWLIFEPSPFCRSWRLKLCIQYWNDE